MNVLLFKSGNGKAMIKKLTTKNIKYMQRVLHAKKFN